MEENRTLLRRSSQRLIAVIYVLIIGIAVGIYFLINDLEQSGIVRDTQTERSWATLILLVIWTLICFRLYRINTRIFDLRSQVFDARETEHFATKEAARLREQFMANMSHEIRTPLNAIIGFTNLLAHSKLGERERELSGNIQIASENLLAIVNDILDFSKIQAGKLVLENIPFDPTGLFHSLQQMFEEKARQKNLSLDVHLAPGLPERLFGDPTRLTQVMVNLMGNALKFTERGGVVVSIVPDSTSGETVDYNKMILRIEVRDSGIGIPAGQIERVFERFTQSDEQTTRIYGGTGLGLSIVKQLVQAMEGSIMLQSDLGKGSHFTITLPFGLHSNNGVIPDNEKPPYPDIKQDETLQVRVLVAEDNPMNRRVVELLFEAWNYDYILTHNGRELVELLLKDPDAFDLVLMDIQMPEMDGYEATRQIRQQYGLKIPIVAMTAHALAGEREKCLQFGMNDYLAKPIREQELHQIIARFAPKRPGIAPEMNLAYVQETTMGKLEYQRELAAIFLQQVPQDLEAISSALLSGDLDAASKAAHNMKSTVGYMGFAQNIGQMLTELEDACNSGKEPALLTRAFQQIQESTRQAKKLVEKAFVE